MTLKDVYDKKCTIFLNMAKAFDTDNHTLLLNKLEMRGIRDCALSLMKSYLSNREHLVKLIIANHNFGYRSAARICTGSPSILNLYKWFAKRHKFQRKTLRRLRKCAKILYKTLLCGFRWKMIVWWQSEKSYIVP